jgi:dTDP-4-amino-4,6-dideoxygalactose transaminase
LQGATPLPHSDTFTDTLLRLPLYYGLEEEDVAKICGVLDGII